MTVAQYIGHFIGAFIAVFLVSRLLLWIMRSWNGGNTRLVLANVIAWLIAGLVAGMGRADGGAFAGLEALMLYGPPQFAVLVIDLLRYHLRRAPA